MLPVLALLLAVLATAVGVTDGVGACLVHGKHDFGTPAGLEALARIEPVRHRANKALLSGFDEKEISLVLRMLRSCLDTLW